jgi:Domain of unknown function (DUF4391)
MPKSKIYLHGKPNAALRALFVAQVESITWAYKLAPETINLPAKPDVPEIEVFEIALKTPDLSHAVLRCIDKAIPFPSMSSCCASTSARPPVRVRHCASNWHVWQSWPASS